MPETDRKSGVFDAGMGIDYNGNALTKADSTGTATYTWDFENRRVAQTINP